MVLFNYATKEITAKVVYYGPGLCGKTTNLQFVYDSLPSNNKSKMLSLATKTDRTLFFDFLPLDLGKIRGMRTKLQLYTVPGQVYYNSTRQLVLKGADGIVFVADSQDFAVDANLESLQNLEDNLKRQGIRIREIPVVIQYNKRDLPNALSVAELNKEVNKLNAPHFESVATSGLGVEETLKGITQMVLSHLVKKYGLEGSEPLGNEIQILNAQTDSGGGSGDSLWDDDEDVPATTTTASGRTPIPARAAAPAAPAPAPAAAAPAAAEARPATIPLSPMSEAEFEFDSGSDDNIPMVATELVQPAANPFGDVYNAAPATAGARAAAEPMEVPFASIEIPLPPGILDSLPVLPQSAPAPAPAPAPAAARPVAPPQPAASPAGERRASDGLVKEVSIPLNLSIEELKNHRRLKLKITLDVNLLP
jgi:signal recognition particle receptor subunit beta